MTEFSGKQLELRSIKPTDFEQVVNWGEGSAESFFLLNLPSLLNRDDLAREITKKGVETLVIQTKKDKKPIGLLKYGPVRMPEKQTQIRMTLDTFEDYSADTLIEAPTLLLDDLFNKKGIYKVHAYTLEFEKEYESLLKKLGFQKEGSYKHHYLHKEKFCSVNIFGLFKKDFLGK